MSSLLSQIHQAIGYINSNVVPPNRVSTPSTGAFIARAPGASYSPVAVNPLKDAGGFNSVIEFATSTCGQQVARAIDPEPMTRTLSGKDLNTLLQSASPGGPLSTANEEIRQLAGRNRRAFQLQLSFAHLGFPDEQTVALRFQVTLAFVYSEPSPTTPAPGQRGTGPLNTFGQSRQDPPNVTPKVVVIGRFTAEGQAPIIHRDEPAQCRTRVFADLRRSTWTEQLPNRPTAGDPPNDLLLVYDACFSDWIGHAKALLRAPLDLPLTPTLSMVGYNPGGYPVPQSTNFDVSVFAVFGSPHFEPALAVALDIMPGCHGIAENVNHFIGPNPYGLISDEVVVDCVFRYKWDTGGFDRQLNIQVPVQVPVTRNGQQNLENAIAFGHEDLISLDAVSIDTDSNSRRDCIFFGGQAQVVPSSITLLTDGQTFTADQVDLGPAQTTQWQVGADLVSGQAQDLRPELQDFQLQASRDGLDPLSRPFAFAAAGYKPAITYVRVAGISRSVFFLGNLDVALD